MFRTETVVMSNSVIQSLISALYRYYEMPNHKMTIGELYLLLKLIGSNLENIMDEMGLDYSLESDDIVQDNQDTKA